MAETNGFKMITLTITIPQTQERNPSLSDEFSQNWVSGSLILHQ